ncbi:hypothetical protein EON65_22805, partial [archaeon]
MRKFSQESVLSNFDQDLIFPEPTKHPHTLPPIKTPHPLRPNLTNPSLDPIQLTNHPKPLVHAHPHPLPHRLHRM